MNARGSEVVRPDGARPKAQVFRLRMGYRGHDFHGWQYQPDVRTVEGELRVALERLVGHPVETQGASRTDTGVHAYGQVVRFELETSLSRAAIARALEALTPNDIRVLRVEAMPNDFSPRFDAIEKRYVYHLATGSAPLFGQDRCWWSHGNLQISAMNEAASHWLGEHDFSSFQNQSQDPPESSIRSIRAARVTQDGNDVFFQVVGNGFLYRMVRNLVGTLVTIGRGRWSPDRARTCLEARDRRAAGPCAPPQGLYLMEIRYPGDPPCRIQVGRIEL